MDFQRAMAEETSSQSYYPDYASYYTRLGTFSNWERQMNCFTVEELAAAGFFVSGSYSLSVSVNVRSLSQKCQTLTYITNFFGDFSELISNTKAMFCFHCNLFVSERTLRSAEDPQDLEKLHERRCDFSRRASSRPSEFRQ